MLILNLVKICQIFFLKMPRNKRSTQKQLSSYYSVSYRPIFTKSNPMQAINPINTHTTVGKDRTNTFPSNERKPSVRTPPEKAKIIIQGTLKYNYTTKLVILKITCHISVLVKYINSIYISAHISIINVENFNLITLFIWYASSYFLL